MVGWLVDIPPLIRSTEISRSQSATIAAINIFSKSLIGVSRLACQNKQDIIGVDWLASPYIIWTGTA